LLSFLLTTFREELNIMEVEKNQSQVAVVPVEGEQPAVVPQADVQPATGEQPAKETTQETTPETAENPKVEIPKVVTEEEHNKAVATERKLRAQAEQQLAQMRLQQETARQQEIERQAQAHDLAEVENGNLTEPQAQARSQLRQQQAQLGQIAQQIVQEKENNAREYAAKRIAKKYEVDDELLINDQNLIDPASMIEKAANLHINKLREELRKAQAKPEHFEKGPTAENSGPKSEDQRLKERYPTMYSK
jgi:hypothetical protein